MRFSILVVWAIITVNYAFLYSSRHVHSPLAEPGFETRYGFQFLMFAIAKLPILLAALGLALVGAELFFRRRRK